MYIREILVTIINMIKSEPIVSDINKILITDNNDNTNLRN